MNIMKLNANYRCETYLNTKVEKPHSIWKANVKNKGQASTNQGEVDDTRKLTPSARKVVWKDFEWEYDVKKSVKPCADVTGRKATQGDKIVLGKILYARTLKTTNKEV